MVYQCDQQGLWGGKECEQVSYHTDGAEYCCLSVWSGSQLHDGQERAGITRWENQSCPQQVFQLTVIVIPVYLLCDGKSCSETICLIPGLYLCYCRISWRGYSRCCCHAFSTEGPECYIPTCCPEKISPALQPELHSFHLFQLWGYKTTVQTRGARVLQLCKRCAGQMDWNRKGNISVASQML